MDHQFACCGGCVAVPASVPRYRGYAVPLAEAMVVKGAALTGDESERALREAATNQRRGR